MTLTVGYAKNAEAVYETGLPHKFKQIKGIDKTNASQENSGDTYEQQTVRFDKQGYPIPYGETLTLTPEEKFFFGIYTRKAQYTYVATGKESIADIQAKFHLKSGAIEECNSYIKTNTNVGHSSEWVPEQGRKIYFYQDAVITK